MAAIVRRLVVAVILSAALTVDAGAQQCFHHGTDRWAIKTSVVPGQTPQPISVDEILALPVPNVHPQSPTYQAQRIPGDFGGFHEGELITTAGWLHLAAFESSGTGDNDYHLQITSDPNDGSNNVIVEIPCQSFVQSGIQQQVTQARQWVRQTLFSGDEPPASPHKGFDNPIYVQVTGQLFFDPHSGGPHARGKAGMPSGTLWEIHPVLSIAQATPGAPLVTDNVTTSATVVMTAPASVATAPPAASAWLMVNGTAVNPASILAVGFSRQGAEPRVFVFGDASGPTELTNVPADDVQQLRTLVSDHTRWVTAQLSLGGGAWSGASDWEVYTDASKADRVIFISAIDTGTDNKNVALFHYPVMPATTGTGRFRAYLDGVSIARRYVNGGVTP